MNEETPVLDRTPVDGACPRCGAAELRRYPVVSEGGWFQVVKCQDCLHSVSREHWALLGPLAMLSDSI
jgi:transposase-like protein